MYSLFTLFFYFSFTLFLYIIQKLIIIYYEIILTNKIIEKKRNMNSYFNVT